MKSTLGVKVLLLAGLFALASCRSDSGGDNSPPVSGAETPNILFVIMDDVGVDQLSTFGYGGAEAPSMPTIGAIADAGVRFRNTWSMPECSPGRSALMTGRYPLRTNIKLAIGPNDLANSQTDPEEITVAKLLEPAGYTSAMFGKYHLAQAGFNEAGNGAPAQSGWGTFYGWVDGVPDSIDTTAGGVAAPGTYNCGYIPDETQPNGASYGACYVPTDSGSQCTEIVGASALGDSAGLQCVSRGGVLVPQATCQADAPAEVNFQQANAHYVSPLVVNAGGNVLEAPLSDTRGRGYRSTIEVNAAIEWINARNSQADPWMTTLSFSSAHTPLQQPPAELLPSGINAELTSDCSDSLNQRRLSDAMIEAMDTELGRLLVETGIAQVRPDGSLIYDSAASNTMVVVIGDNGSFGPVVKAPLDPNRAKGSTYQTGVWVPLIVAGPMVEAPGRAVEHMINAVDVFQLFGETAGIDVSAAVPRGVDSVSMQPYLADPAQESLREYNFTQGGLNIQVNGGRNGPCVFFGSSCSHTPISKSVCEDNAGVWWGLGADDPTVLKGALTQCWEVNQAIYDNDPANYDTNRIVMSPTGTQAVRNDAFKLVRNQALDYDVTTDTGVEVVSEEFYAIDQNPILPQLDRAGLELDTQNLNPQEQSNLALLQTELNTVLASQPSCPGDGNGDGVVDDLDLSALAVVQARWGGSSTYDFNIDGFTNDLDRDIINANLGPCPQP
ncbi:sulfatase-like hydrolase/transferase [Halopseudomonas salina]|uniref:Sulfatase N-terminal domain-containing protein n=1 Tax=Halopseudomonas salina TaxID=1323744 RepID=A0ABQ1PRA0_9GAMM|nr:sulfatase-like hydrolase/transferase [Halopseudomonas salina]GGD01466.1 hypothetical protein GCM10007418_20920 [Halopseudomonas salina]